MKKHATKIRGVFFMFYFLLFGAEIVLADAAELAGKIFGEIFPLDALFFLVVNPAADIANVLHCYFLL